MEHAVGSARGEQLLPEQPLPLRGDPTKELPTVALGAFQSSPYRCSGRVRRAAPTVAWGGRGEQLLPLLEESVESSSYCCSGRAVPTVSGGEQSLLLLGESSPYHGAVPRGPGGTGGERARRCAGRAAPLKFGVHGSGF